MKKEIVASVLAVVMLMPTTGLARRHKHTYWFLTGATDGTGPGALSYRDYHRPNWNDFKAWEILGSGDMPVFDPVGKEQRERQQKIDKKRVEERKNENEEKKKWNDELKQWLQKYKEEMTRGNGVSLNQMLEDILASTIRIAGFESEKKMEVGPEYRGIEVENGLTKEKIKQGKFNEWRKQKREEELELYKEQDTLRTEYLKEAQRMRKKADTVYDGNENTIQLAQKQMKIEQYDEQIENIREKIERTGEVVETGKTRLETEEKNANEKVTSQDMYTHGTYDPYNPSEKDIERGATAPNKNKKLPKPF